jgi:hypothetical protein
MGVGVNLVLVTPTLVAAATEFRELHIKVSIRTSKLVTLFQCANSKGWLVSIFLYHH